MKNNLGSPSLMSLQSELKLVLMEIEVSNFDTLYCFSFLQYYDQVTQHFISTEYLQMLKQAHHLKQVHSLAVFLMFLLLCVVIFLIL